MPKPICQSHSKVPGILKLILPHVKAQKFNMPIWSPFLSYLIGLSAPACISLDTVNVLAQSVVIYADNVAIPPKLY